VSTQEINGGSLSELKENGMSSKSVIKHFGNISKKEDWIKTHYQKIIYFLLFVFISLHERAVCTSCVPRIIENI